MQINPGELNKKIQIYTVAAKTDESGFAEETETLFLTCNAKVSRTSGTEIIKSNADFGVENMRFLIRYSRGINRKMIIKYAGETYQIEYVNDYEDAHRYIEIFASRVA